MNTNILNNPILSTDSYKFSHAVQYPQDTADIYAYLEARGSKIKNCDEVVFFGLQSYIRNRLTAPVTKQNVEQAKVFCEAHGVPFNYDGWMYIVKEHNGFLPVEIRAVPEGSVVLTGHPLLTVHTTDPKCAWLTCYLETDIMRACWYGSTVASISRHCKKIIKRYLDKTSDAPEAELPFKLHDFGFRGVSSFESGGIGGAAHLVNFMGTDTVAGILHAMEYYDADVCGYSIPASEHSTMTSWTKEGELAAYRNMVEQYAKKGSLFACVIDSYNFINAAKMWAEDPLLLDRVKEIGSTAVLRPDSGDPTVIPIQLIEFLMNHPKVGYSVNSKGYKVLPNHVRVIQGDGITFETLEQILALMEEKKISASNIAFGMGAGLLQKCDRDTFKFAMKASARQKKNGEWVDVFKEPITDSGKRSKRGRVTTAKVSGRDIVTTLDMINQNNNKMENSVILDSLQRVYVYDAFHGLRVKFDTFDEIRKRAAI